MYHKFLFFSVIGCPNCTKGSKSVPYTFAPGVAGTIVVQYCVFRDALLWPLVPFNQLAQSSQAINEAFLPKSQTILFKQQRCFCGENPSR